MIKISENVVCKENHITLSQISSDIELTLQEKNYLIYFLASSDLLSQKIEQFQLLNTRTTKAECDKAYMTALERIVRNYTISGGTALLVTGHIGLGISTVLAYIALDDAESDYNKCLSNTQNR